MLGMNSNLQLFENSSDAVNNTGGFFILKHPV